MPVVVGVPPLTAIDPVTEIFHGASVVDPYRWLEDQDSPRTRDWLEQQTHYARAYLDNVPGRHRIRERITEFLSVETYDSLQKVGNRYFFRKRLPDQEQPCIYMREGVDGEDQLLIDPAERDTGKFTAVKPLRVSGNGRLLLYEVKDGGERTGTFELLDIEARKRLPDRLGRGYLRGFAFAPDCTSFFYVHEPHGGSTQSGTAAYQHILGQRSTADRELLSFHHIKNARLGLIGDDTHLCFMLYKFGENPSTDIYFTRFDGDSSIQPAFAGIRYMLAPRLLNHKILAITDRNAPNCCIVEIRLPDNAPPECLEVVPECDMKIHNWFVAGDSILLLYANNMNYKIVSFDFMGNKISDLEIPEDETATVVGTSDQSDELFLQVESFRKPPEILRYSHKTGSRTPWNQKAPPFDSASCHHRRCSFIAKDGTQVPLFLVGRKDVITAPSRPTVMTAYGGFGASMTPQFSIFASYLMERGCLFAIPLIRGGGEFGVKWHEAAKRRSRQTAFDDFLCAAEWLIAHNHTHPNKLAIFGGSNSGLLVGAALTQRPDLFRAAICLAPILDMLRYHLFNTAHLWKDEFGTADDPNDFAALIKYSPYHQVRDGIAYPATMIVSGDADQNCNPLHARKMTARLQTANISEYPILLDYNKSRGHSPVLPLSTRIEALTDRLAFICDQLQIVA